MAKNRSGFLRQITLWNKGPQYVQKHDGFGHTFDLKGIVEGAIPGGYVLDYVQGTDIDVYRESAGRIPGLRLIEFPDGTCSLASTPYLHVWPTQAASHWTLTPANEWVSYDEDFGELHLDHAYSDSTAFATAESVFKLPPDPWFAIRLQRGEPNEDWPSTTLPYSYVEFGKEYRIVAPYSGPVRLYVAGSDAWLELRPEGGGDGLSGFEGLDHNEAKFLSVGCLRGHILLSDDGFSNNIVFYKIPVGDSYLSEALLYAPRYWVDSTETDYPRVWSWRVTVGHNAGDFGFTYYPVWPVRHKTPTSNNAPYLLTPSVNFDYKHTENPVRPAIDVWSEPRKPAWDNQAEFQVIETTPTYTVRPSVTFASGSVYTGWLDIGWQPAMWTSVYGAGSVYSHLVAPAVHQVQLWQPAWFGSVAGTSNVLSLGWSKRLSNEYVEVGCEEEFGPMTARLKFVEGANAYTCRLLEPFRRIRIRLGTRYTSGAATTVDTATVFDGYVATPGLSTLRGLHDDIARGEWVAFCDAKRLTDAKAHQREPAFDLFSASGAATWAWGRAGVPSAHLSFAAAHATHILHGLGRDLSGAKRIYQGFVKDDRWSPEAGTEWLAVMRDIGRAADNSQWWCDPATRTYKLSKAFWSNTVTTSHLIREGPLGHASGAYRVFDFNVEARSFDGDEFANRVTLLGKDRDGNAIWGTRKDTSSAWNATAENFAGRWIDHVDTRDDLRTRADLEAAADSMLTALSMRADRATITTDPIIGLRRGHLLKTSGGTNGPFDLYSCVNGKWLVTGYAHSWNKSDGPMGLRTTAQLKWWGY